MSGRYLYAIVSADARVPVAITGLDREPVTLHRHAGCAAVVSAISATRPLGTREDLLAHQGVLTALTGPDAGVLPLRFGTVLSDPEAVTTLLAAGAAAFTAALERVRGRAEFRFKARYVTDSAVAEVLTERPELAALAARVSSIPQDAAYYDQIGLGRAIAAALEVKAGDEARQMMAELAPHSDGATVHDSASQEEVLDAAFLVDFKRRHDFEDAVGRLATSTSGRLRLRLAGPLPPYDFAAPVQASPRVS